MTRVQALVDAITLTVNEMARRDHNFAKRHFPDGLAIRPKSAAGLPASLLRAAPSQRSGLEGGHAVGVAPPRGGMSRNSEALSGRFIRVPCPFVLRWYSAVVAGYQVRYNEWPRHVGPEV